MTLILRGLRASTEAGAVQVLKRVGDAAAAHPAAADLFMNRLPHSAPGRLALEVVRSSFCAAGFNDEAARLVSNRSVRWAVDHRCLMASESGQPDAGGQLLEAFFLAGARTLARSTQANRAPLLPTNAG